MAKVKTQEAIDWTKEIQWAEQQLGIRKYVSVKDNPTCYNAEFVTKTCDNVNLEENGFCQICGHQHRMMLFGKEIKCDQLPMDNSFGNGVSDDVFESGYFNKSNDFSSDTDWDEQEKNLIILNAQESIRNFLNKEFAKIEKSIK